MGLLNDLRDSATRISPALLMTEDKDSAVRYFRDSKISRAARIYDEGTFYDPREKRERRYSEWTGLGELLESENPRDQWKAACTLESIAKTQNFILVPRAEPCGALVHDRVPSRVRLELRVA
jgi:hypothetical protein